MARLVKFTTIDQVDVFINPEHVQCVSPYGDYVEIEFTDTAVVTVTGKIDEVVTKLRDEDPPRRFIQR